MDLVPNIPNDRRLRKKRTAEFMTAQDVLNEQYRAAETSDEREEIDALQKAFLGACDTGVLDGLPVALSVVARLEWEAKQRRILENNAPTTRQAKKIALRLGGSAPAPGPARTVKRRRGADLSLLPGDDETRLQRIVNDQRRARPTQTVHIDTGNVTYRMPKKDNRRPR
jgi:hypothetical protein